MHGPASDNYVVGSVGQYCRIKCIKGLGLQPDDMVTAQEYALTCGAGKPIDNLSGDGIAKWGITNLAIFDFNGADMLLSIPGIYRVCY